MTDPDLSERIVAVCQKFANGATQTDLENGLGVKAAVFFPLLNKLTAEKKLDVLQKGSTIVFRANTTVRSERAKKLVSNDVAEKIVYQAIEKSEDAGINVRDIQMKTNLNGTRIQKIVKKLEKDRFIKSFTAINKRGTKLYIVADLEPSASRTGGAFYKDTVFDVEFVAALKQMCIGFLQKKARESEQNATNETERVRGSRATAEEIMGFIKLHNVSASNRLTSKEIEQTLGSLVLEDKILLRGEATKMYQIKNAKSATFSSSTDTSNQLTTSSSPVAAKTISSFGKSKNTPFVSYNTCIHCPREDVCKLDRGQFTPTTCDYMKEWNNLDW